MLISFPLENSSDLVLLRMSLYVSGLGNGILTSSVYIVEVVAATRRGSVVMVRHSFV